MEQKEIFFCDLIVLKNNKKVKLEKCVWMESRTHHKNMEIVEVIKIKSLGFQALQAGYTEVQKSDEKRNTTTGAYD